MVLQFFTLCFVQAFLLIFILVKFFMDHFFRDQQDPKVQKEIKEIKDLKYVFSSFNDIVLLL